MMPSSLVSVRGSSAAHTLNAMARTYGKLPGHTSPVCDDRSSTRTAPSRSRSSSKARTADRKVRSGPSGRHKYRPTVAEMREMLLMSKAEAECLRVLKVEESNRLNEKREASCMMKAEIDTLRSDVHDLRQGEHGWEQVLAVLMQQTDPTQVAMGDGLEMLKGVIIQQARAIAIYKRKWQLACFMMGPE